MNSISFGKEVYGVRWGKYINEDLHIFYEQNNMYDLQNLKEKVKMTTEKFYYFVLKMMYIKRDNNTFSTLDWVGCEKDVILNL